MTWNEEVKKAVAENPGKGLQEILPIAKERWAKIKKSGQNTTEKTVKTVSSAASSVSSLGSKSEKGAKSVIDSLTPLTS